VRVDGWQWLAARVPVVSGRAEGLLCKSKLHPSALLHLPAACIPHAALQDVVAEAAAALQRQGH
jgi:hypothetical protein